MKSKRGYGMHAQHHRTFRSFTSAKLPKQGEPKFKVGDRVGNFVINYYHGHTAVNQRTNRVMSKEHHWYGCTCDCGSTTKRSQQELTDERRTQQCHRCQVREAKAKQTIPVTKEEVSEDNPERDRDPRSTDPICQ